MEPRSKDKVVNKYSISIIVLIILAAVAIFFIWSWFDHKNKEIEKQLINYGQPL